MRKLTSTEICNQLVRIKPKKDLYSGAWFKTSTESGTESRTIRFLTEGYKFKKNEKIKLAGVPTLFSKKFLNMRFHYNEDNSLKFISVIDHKDGQWVELYKIKKGKHEIMNLILAQCTVRRVNWLRRKKPSYNIEY